MGNPAVGNPPPAGPLPEEENTPLKTKNAAVAERKYAHTLAATECDGSKEGVTTHSEVLIATAVHVSHVLPPGAVHLLLQLHG